MTVERPPAFLVAELRRVRRGREVVARRAVGLIEAVEVLEAFVSGDGGRRLCVGLREEG